MDSHTRRVYSRQIRSYLILYNDALRATHAPVVAPLWSLVCDYVEEDLRILDLLLMTNIDILVQYTGTMRHVMHLGATASRSFYVCSCDDWGMSEIEAISTLLMIPSTLESELDNVDIYMRRVLYAMINGDAPPLDLIVEE